MYEVFFNLSRRPFSATPSANCFVQTESIQETLDELIVCVQRGQGIGILTAPQGTGKTVICKKLSAELHNDFRVVFLPTSNYSSSRALLQAVLYELGHPYSRMDDQELRLELNTAVKAVRPDKQAVVLILDEAHLLGEDLLEEIRTITNLAEHGSPLVRVILSGHLQLEEKLTSPQLDALNQRIRAQVSLQPLTREESCDYLSSQINWAGQSISNIFSSEAVSLIVHASDGVPRCLNQLADHCLLLAYVAEQKPVTVEIVREALVDLRQLPLHWNEPSAEYDDLAKSSQTPFESLDDSEGALQMSDVDLPFELTPEHNDEFRQTADVGVETNDSIEFGIRDTSFPAAGGYFEIGQDADLEADQLLAGEPNVETVEIGISEPPIGDRTEPSTPSMELPGDHRVDVGESHLEPEDSEEFEEIVVDDFYALIDAGKQDSDVSGIVWDIASVDQKDAAAATDAAESKHKKLTIVGPIDEDPPPENSEASIAIQVVEAGTNLGQSEHPDPPADDESADAGDLIVSSSLDEQSADLLQDLRPDLIIDDILPHLSDPAEAWVYPNHPVSDQFNAFYTSDVVQVEQIDGVERLPIEDNSMDVSPNSGPNNLYPVSERTGPFDSGTTPHPTDMDCESLLVAESLDQDDSIEHDIGTEVLDTCLETQQVILDRLNGEHTLSNQNVGNSVVKENQEYTPRDLDAFDDYDVVQPESESTTQVDDDNGIRNAIEDRRLQSLHADLHRNNPAASPRPYQRLFSELRRRQQQEQQ